MNESFRLGDILHDLRKISLASALVTLFVLLFSALLQIGVAWLSPQNSGDGITCQSAYTERSNEQKVMSTGNVEPTTIINQITNTYCAEKIEIHRTIEQIGPLIGNVLVESGAQRVNAGTSRWMQAGESDPKRKRGD